MTRSVFLILKESTALRKSPRGDKEEEMVGQCSKSIIQ